MVAAWCEVGALADGATVSLDRPFPPDEKGGAENMIEAELLEDEKANGSAADAPKATLSRGAAAAG